MMKVLGMNLHQQKIHQQSKNEKVVEFLASWSPAAFTASTVAATVIRSIESVLSGLHDEGRRIVDAARLEGAKNLFHLLWWQKLELPLRCIINLVPLDHLLLPLETSLRARRRPPAPSRRHSCMLAR